MGLFKSKSKVYKKDIAHQNERKQVKYVWLSSRKAIFIIRGEVKESKYSYGLPILPLHGYYKSEGKTYTAKELSEYYVILNLPKTADISELKGKKVVIVGYDKDEIYIDKDDEEGSEEE